MTFRYIPYTTQGWKDLFRTIQDRLAQGSYIIQAVRRREIEATRERLTTGGVPATGSASWPIDTEANEIQGAALYQVMTDIKNLSTLLGSYQTAYKYVIKPGRPPGFNNITILSDADGDGNYFDQTSFTVTADNEAPFADIVMDDSTGDYVGFKLVLPSGAVYEDSYGQIGYQCLGTGSSSSKLVIGSGHLLEHIANGKFTSSSDYWDLGTNWRRNIVSAWLEDDGTPTDYAVTQSAYYFTQPLVAGVPYRLHISYTRSAGSLAMSLMGQDAVDDNGDPVIIGEGTSSPYLHTFTLTEDEVALGDNSGLSITGTGFDGNIDNVSLVMDLDGTYDDFEIFLVRRDDGT